MADKHNAFVCGYPIKHSRSPLIHSYWLRKYGIEGSYRAVEVAPEEFLKFISHMSEHGYIGGNITIPHKEMAFSACKKLDPAANVIGAVNTVWLENGELIGGNTDAYGFLANLDALVPNWDKKRDGSVKKALVLGAGGAARAIIYALQQRGYQHIHIVNRTVERAQELADHFGDGISVHSWKNADNLVSEVSLIVNTTSLGMAGHGDQEDGFPLSFAQASPETIATDIVYVPLETPFLRKAAAAGLKTADGLGMLLHQAVPGFEKWFGVRPEVCAQTRQIILDDLA